MALLMSSNLRVYLNTHNAMVKSLVFQQDIDINKQHHQCLAGAKDAKQVQYTLDTPFLHTIYIACASEIRHSYPACSPKADNQILTQVYIGCICASAHSTRIHRDKFSRPHAPSTSFSHLHLEGASIYVANVVCGRKKSRNIRDQNLSFMYGQ